MVMGYCKHREVGEMGADFWLSNFSSWAFAKICKMRACIYIYLHMHLNACFILFYDEMVCWLKTAYNFCFCCFIYRWSRVLIYLVIVFQKYHFSCLSYWDVASVMFLHICHCTQTKNRHSSWLGTTSMILKLLPRLRSKTLRTSWRTCRWIATHLASVHIYPTGISLPCNCIEVWRWIAECSSGKPNLVKRKGWYTHYYIIIIRIMSRIMLGNWIWT